MRRIWLLRGCKNRNWLFFFKKKKRKNKMSCLNHSGSSVVFQPVRCWRMRKLNLCFAVRRETFQKSWREGNDLEDDFLEIWEWFPGNLGMVSQNQNNHCHFFFFPLFTLLVLNNSPPEGVENCAQQCWIYVLTIPIPHVPLCSFPSSPSIST